MITKLKGKAPNVDQRAPHHQRKFALKILKMKTPAITIFESEGATDKEFVQQIVTFFGIESVGDKDFVPQYVRFFDSEGVIDKITCHMMSHS